MIKDSVINPIQAPPVASLAKVPDAKPMTLESGATGKSGSTSASGLNSGLNPGLNPSSNPSHTTQVVGIGAGGAGGGVRDTLTSLNGNGSNGSGNGMRTAQDPNTTGGFGQGIDGQKSVDSTQGKPEDDGQIRGMVESLNDYFQAEERNLEFSVDDSTGRTVITVLERESREVIRQIPPEQMLALGEHLLDGGNIGSTGVAEEA